MEVIGAMRFNFVIPSWSYWAEPTRAQPLTQMYLATILREEGHDIVFTDNRERPMIPVESDAYMYTVASPDVKEVESLVRLVRHSQGGYHIAGGPHPSIFPEESLKVFDAIAIGRGEEAILSMATDIKRGKLALTYESINEGRNYPFPRRDFIPKDKVVTSLFKTKDISSTTVLFSHGCPYACSFCANYTKGPVINRTLESISQEIDYLKENYGIKGLSLQDEICIPYNKGRAEAFLGVVAGKNVAWRGQSRAGVPGELLARASESGCLELSFGLESVDQDVLNKTRKRMNVETVRKTLNDCKAYGIKTRLYLLNGLPGEKDDIVDKTKRFIGETNPDVVLLSTLQPYPGSDIHDHPERYGIKWIDKDYSKYNHLRCRFMDSADRIEDAVPFEYENGLTRRQIASNLIQLQNFLIDRGMNK